MTNLTTLKHFKFANYKIRAYGAYNVKNSKLSVDEEKIGLSKTDNQDQDFEYNKLYNFVSELVEKSVQKVCPFDR